MAKNRIVDYLQEAGAGLLSGAGAGVLLGIGARLSMRMVALATHFPPEASVEGTLGIIVIGIIIGALTGLLFAGLLHLLPVPQSLWYGPLYGLTVMALLTPFLLPRLAEEVALLSTPAQGIVATGCFGLSFYIYGLALQALFARLRQSQRASAVAMTLALFGFLSLAFSPSAEAAGTSVPNDKGQPVPATFVNQERNTTSASLQIDAQGGLHLAYVSDPQGEAYYSSCAASANCAVQSQWQRLALGHNVLEIQLALTPQGSPRLLLLIHDDDPLTSGMNDTWWYAACDSSCSQQSGWQMIFLDGHVDADGSIFATSNHYFALDAGGAPRAILGPKADFDPDSFETYDYSVYASCDHDCTATAGIDPQSGKAIPANWSFARIRGLLRQPALALTSTGQPRLAAFTPANDGNGSDELSYFACDQGCDLYTNWRNTRIGEPSASQQSIVLRLNSQDLPRLALFAEDSHATYLWCNSACTEQAQWGMTPLATTLTGGGDPDLQFDLHDHPRIAYQWREQPTEGEGRVGLGYAWCDSACESPQPHFQQTLVEASTRLDADWMLPRPSNCVFGQWLSAYRPALAIDAHGDPHIAYDADFVIGSCLGQPGTTVTTHKGVRYTFFGQANPPDPEEEDAGSLLFLPALVD